MQWARASTSPVVSESVAVTDGFPPIVGRDPRILILGSLPSRKSVEKHEYYGHPRNAFWPIMGELFGAEPTLDYETRKSIIASRGVAVWDVLASSVRPGSLDADIDAATAIPNDIDGFLADYPAVRLVCFNGQAAAKLHARLLAKASENRSNTVKYQTLPSTSPAHAAMSFDQKLAHWRIVAEATKQ